jgi:hypothetical protein
MNGKIKKANIIFLSVIFSITTLFLPFSVKAGAWGEPIQAAFLKESLERAYKAFEDSMVAGLKMVASNLITDRMRALLAGSSSSKALYITNYEDFLFSAPQREAQLVMGDFFDTIATGASSATKESINRVQSAIDYEIFGIMEDVEKPDIDEYVEGGAENIFDQTKGGGLSAFNATFDNPYNNPYGLYDRAYRKALNEKLSQEKKAEVIAVANQGFRGKINSETNLVELPGIMAKDLASFAESIPMRIVAYAKSIPEVVGTFAAQAITQTIQSGINQVTEPIDNQLINVNRTVKGGYREVQRTIYNGIKFTD